MSYQAVDRAFFIKNITPSEKLILLTLGKFYNGSTNQCNPSINTISDVSGVSKRTVIRSINRLESLKIIALNKTKHANGFENNTTQYQLLYLLASDNLSSASDNLSSASDNLSSASDNLSSASDTVSPNKGYEKGKEYVFETHTKTPASKNSANEKPARVCDEKKTNEIVLSPEQDSCRAWALAQPFWHKQVKDKIKFLGLYNNGSARGVKVQFEEWQAQKSPLDANQAGSNYQSTSEGITRENYNTNYPTAKRKLSTADRHLYAAIRGEYYDRFQSGLITETEYQNGIRQYAT